VVWKRRVGLQCLRGAPDSLLAPSGGRYQPHDLQAERTVVVCLPLGEHSTMHGANMLAMSYNLPPVRHTTR
jgi:hypothetical protein